MHSVASNAIPEAELSEKEAKQLAAAIVEVDKAFPSNIDPRMIAVANLIGACGLIYGPRVMAALMRMRMERQNRANPQPSIRPARAAAVFDGDAAFSVVAAFTASDNPPPMDDGFQTSRNTR